MSTFPPPLNKEYRNLAEVILGRKLSQDEERELARVLAKLRLDFRREDIVRSKFIGYVHSMLISPEEIETTTKEEKEEERTRDETIEMVESIASPPPPSPLLPLRSKRAVFQPKPKIAPGLTPIRIKMLAEKAMQYYKNPTEFNRYLASLSEEERTEVMKYVEQKKREEQALIDYAMRVGLIVDLDDPLSIELLQSIQSNALRVILVDKRTNEAMDLGPYGKNYMRRKLPEILKRYNNTMKAVVIPE